MTVSKSRLVHFVKEKSVAPQSLKFSPSIEISLPVKVHPNMPFKGEVLS